MKNKSLIIIIAVFAIILIGAGVLYSTLSEDVAPASQLQTQPLATQTPVEDSAATDSETAENTEASEPEVIPAPDFTVYDKDGNPVKLSDFIGKPVIINFWASWCGYCMIEMPEFETAYQQYGEDIHFLMVNATDGSRETVDTAQKTVDEGGYTFPVYFDSELEASYTYGAYSLPMTFGIDAEGNAIVRANGAIDASTIDQIIGMITE